LRGSPQRCHSGSPVPQLVGRHGEPVCGLADDELAALAIEDRSARCGQRRSTLVLSQGPATPLRALDDLQLNRSPENAEACSEQRQLQKPMP
jgi:hypothetical protein